MEKKPKFKVGDKVVMRSKTLYNETEGIITEIDKLYAETRSDGTFEPRGLYIAESTIGSIQLPYTHEGDTLTVTYPGNYRRVKYVFKKYSYCVETPKMKTLYPEGSLKLK